MLTLTDDKWNDLFDIIDDTIQNTIKELPEVVQEKANEILIVLDKYVNMEGATILGLYKVHTNGPIIIYVGQIYEACGQDIEETKKSARQVYFHELAHALGNLSEYEVHERGL